MSCSKSGRCKLREYRLLIGYNYAGLTPYTEFTSLAVKQVCLASVKSATSTVIICCKKWNHSLLSAKTSRNLQQTGLLQDRFDSWVVKRATLLFDSFCSCVANQVVYLCCPFYRTLSNLGTHFLPEARFSNKFRELSAGKRARKRKFAQALAFPFSYCARDFWRYLPNGELSHRLYLFCISCISLNGDCAFSIFWLSFYPWCTLVIVTNLPCYLKVSLVRGSRWKYAKKRRKRWVIFQFCCFCSR